MTPAVPPAAGRFLFLDPHGAGSPWPERGTMSNPIVSDAVRDHPLLEHVSLADLNVGVARRLATAAGDVAVARALAVPLLIARARPGLKAVGLTFDVRRSDLPMRGAFPLLIANALRWLADRPPSEALSFPTGRTVRLGGVPVPLDRAGFHQVAGATSTTTGAASAAGAAAVPTRVAANLASAVESDTAPRPALRIAGRTPGRPNLPRPQPRHPFWQLAALAALAVALVEWTTFHRRLTV